MSKYFNKLPKLYYNSQLATDITRRTKFVETYLSDPFLFLPYTITEQDKPEDISLYYYGSVDYTWLVLLANSMYDPYYDWVLNEEDFDKYIIAKYAEQSGKIGIEVVSWSQNETLYENILYLIKDDEYINPETVLIDIAVANNTISLLETNEGKQALFDLGISNEYSILRIYEYEQILNENKRQIRLVDKKYLQIIEKQFKELMKVWVKY